MHGYVQMSSAQGCILKVLEKADTLFQVEINEHES
jgi:hypothetical protein